MYANQYTAPTAEFDNSNPTGAGGQARGLLRDLWTRLQGYRTHPYGPEKSDPSITWNGVAAAPQSFQGLNLTTGGTAYRNDGFADISTGLIEGPLGDPARRIFAARLKRQAPMGGI